MIDDDVACSKGMDMLSAAAAQLRLSDVTTTWRRPPLAGCASPVNISPSRKPYENRTHHDHPAISTTSMVRPSFDMLDVFRGL
jgi:hypothetical protein